MSRIRWSAALSICAALVVPAVAVITPCYVNIDRSCGALHADTTKFCNSGSTSAPCGDLIISDANVCDIRAAAPEADGKKAPINMNACTVTVEVQYFFCNGAACQQGSTLTRTCVGRAATGLKCTGPAGDELP